ncbi:MAG: DUF2914 domain-containing protein [Patescibacteria group bacterium]
MIKVGTVKIKQFYSRYERFLIPGALLFGVITDALLFSSINFRFAFTILFLHFTVSGLVIAFIHLYNEGFLRYGKVLRLLRIFSPLVLQYTFGALLSGFLIFYWFSSSFMASWPFIFIIVVLMVSNDLLRRYYLWMYVQVGVYFFITFSLFVLVLPFIVKSVGTVVFLAGGVLSLFVIALYLYALSRFLPKIYEKRRGLVSIVASIFILMNVMYFTNIIPPVPLNLREAEVAHFIERDNGDYLLKTEDKDFFAYLIPGKRVHLTKGDRLYFFSSVFAPVWLGADIVHHWQYYDSDQSKWTTRSRVSFPIVGGREEGYRGYSFIENVTGGKWRVLVENSRGQVIGKEGFKVKMVDEKPSFIFEKR